MTVGFRSVIRFVTALGSVLTMVFSPVAQGLESQNTLNKQLAAYLTETQLNKRITYKEFWEKTKHLYSGQIYYDVERYLTATPNELMPEFTLRESLSSTGERIPTLTLNEKGKQYTLQIFGEKQKFAKFNNVTISENDLLLVTPAIKRITASDIKIKKEHDRKLLKASQNKFSGFPSLDKAAWKKMSQKERAMYVLLMRQTWSDARRVLEIIDQDKSSQAPSEKKKKTSKLENLLRLLESEAWASGRDGVGCLVAGYISEYKGGICSVKMIPKHYDANEPLVKKSMDSCTTTKPGSISCNPYIYGAPGGSPICISPSLTDSSFQVATHAKGPCDSASPLGKPSDFPFLVDPKKTGPERYADSNLKKGPDGKPVNLAAEYKRQQAENASYVENYLTGLLKLSGNDVNFSEALSNDTLAAILDIKQQFDLETINAVENCKNEVSKKHEKNFWEACDQMQRRFLFVAEFLTKKPGCPDNKSVNPVTLKCPCDGGGEANPGAQCVAVKPVAEEAAIVEASIDCGQKFPGLGTTVSDDGKSCLCENGKEPSGEPAKCKAGWNWKPWAIGAGVLAVLGFMLYRHNKNKDKKRAFTFPIPKPGGGSCQTVCAANMTQNPTTCACEPIVVQPACQAPLDPVTCQCPAANACTPGQQVYNLSTCQCDTVVQPGICPDGVTQYMTPPGSSSCPAPTVCQNGTQVYPPAQCPPVNEGGSGSSCPNGGCSGGVPTAN